MTFRVTSGDKNRHLSMGGRRCAKNPTDFQHLVAFFRYTRNFRYIPWKSRAAPRVYYCFVT